MTDLDRMRNEYSARARRFAGKDLYSVFNTSYLFALQNRQRDLLRALRKTGFQSFCGQRILEIGCGGGGVLLEYLSIGAEPERLFGVDLLPDRLFEAHNKLPLSCLSCTDGQDLPFPAKTFDLVLQYTAFSSVLDDQIKRRMASDMLRVLKPDGLIVWYDFWLNPTNLQTRGIQPKEIRRLFGGCDIHFHKITLAPPIARRIVPISWGIGLFLESLKIFNSHFLAIIRPR
ncbi:MAG TPA: class I SAM-dependent methyltransferase [Anaerolineaceae bacterium]|nr:class I SAM-dependent methyltransferase [Anaerolineaceae bacterium]HQH85113.1 class I SAM-dependent methyltransferase [Anaerolineaceae bacterium]